MVFIYKLIRVTSVGELINKAMKKCKIIDVLNEMRVLLNKILCFKVGCVNIQNCNTVER